MISSPTGTLADAWALSRNGQFDDALALAGELVAQDGNSIGALRLLATLTLQNGEQHRALSLFDRILTLSGPTPDVLVEMGEAQRVTGNLASARASFQEALTLSPKNPAALRGLAQTNQALGNQPEALAAFRAALAILPYDKYAAHMVAALSGEAGSASASYVADLFDTYADEFDQHLTGNLGYNTPFFIADMLQPHAPASLLDLGCGTGLVGMALRDTIPLIDGIDIAPQMIRKARERNIYRHVAAVDFISALADDPDFAGPYDAIAAADVLVYIGPLEATFAAVVPRLAPRGLFALSIETSEGADVTLLPSGRYAHSARYITDLAAQHGLSIIEQTSTPIRQERSEPIPGMLFLLQIPALAPHA